jgi:hypothetical protein
MSFILGDFVMIIPVCFSLVLVGKISRPNGFKLSEHADSNLKLTGSTIAPQDVGKSGNS